jgi:hypothetical protein
MIKSPCTGECTKRSATCHGACQEYLDYVEAKKVEREQIANNKKYFSNHTSFVVQQRMNWKRNHR